MILFIIGWNIAEADQAAAVHSLQRAARGFPQIDEGTLWQRSVARGAGFAAALSTSPAAAAPRQYTEANEDGFLLFSGLPICPSGAYPAHRARSLWDHWERLPAELEGQYFAARAREEPASLELMGDLLGAEQLFYARRGASWLISNSVQAIDGTLGPSSLDPLGVSLFLATGWVGADRTLREGIRVFPGGQRWTLRAGAAEPQVTVYHSPADLSRLPRKPLTEMAVAALADRMTAICRSLHASFGAVECPLTAGRDSRLLAALLINAGLPAQYYTSGDPASLDVQIGTRIARQFGLPHRVNPVTAADVASRWEEVAWLYVRRYDGMSSFWQIADVLAMPDQIDELPVNLWGIGGEIGRGFYSEPALFLGRGAVADVQGHLAGKVIARHDGLLSPATEAQARGYLDHFVAQCAADGFPAVDAPDLFYAYQRIGRWAGNNARKTAPVCDHFSPFCSRAWLEATFSLSTLQRTTEPLHYQLILRLAPELHSMPFEKGAWRRQQPWLNLAEQSWRSPGWRSRVRRFVPQAALRRRRQAAPAKASKAFDHAHWLEARLSTVRAVCLDQAQSPLWDFVARPVFERLTEPAAAEARARHSMALFSAITLFYYEADRRQVAG